MVKKIVEKYGGLRVFTVTSQGATDKITGTYTQSKT